MSVNTKRATGRRELHFDSLDDVLADAEQVGRRPHRALGNWTAGQIFMHLARAIDGSIDGLDIPASWPVRLVGRWYMKRRILHGKMLPGFKLPKPAQDRYVPGETTVDAGLRGLAEAIERFKSAPDVAPHPIFGPLNKMEATQLHLRHAELHLSFLTPEQ